MRDANSHVEAPLAVFSLPACLDGRVTEDCEVSANRILIHALGMVDGRLSDSALFRKNLEPVGISEYKWSTRGVRVCARANETARRFQVQRLRREIHACSWQVASPSIVEERGFAVLVLARVAPTEVRIRHR